MIELRGVRVAYADRPEPVLAGLDLTLVEGELVVVSGRTGSGKSTLLGVLSGLVPRFTGGALHGDLLIDGHSVLHLPPRERADVIGSVAQNPASGFVTDSVEEELAYGMEQLGYPPATMRRRVEETLDLLGIAELRHRDLRTLSGGQQQRVAIGSVLTTHPRLLVLDEPTSALDPTAAEEVLATITRLVHDVGVTVVLAEHRLERVVPFADRICLLDGGSTRVGAPAEILATSPVVPPIVELGRLLAWQPLPLTVRDARAAARREPPAITATITAPVSDSPTSTGHHSLLSEPLLTANAVTVTHGPSVAVDSVDLAVRPGEVVALMGRNGSGKSSLLWALHGAGDRRSGMVRVLTDDGPRDPARLEPAARRSVIGLVPQNPADLLYRDTVDEECSTAGDARGVLDRLLPGLPGDVHPRDLSEGERLAVALAVILSARPRIVLLDEPTRGLDYAAKARFAAILGELATEGHAIVVATHDVEFAAAVAHLAIVLADGAVVSSGPAGRVLTESPAFAPQVAKVLGAPWLRVDQVASALEPA